MLETIERRWNGLCIVAGSGPSLTPATSELCRGHHVVATKDAWRLFPFAEVLYGCDAWWWEHYDGVREFRGERWSSHETPNRSQPENDKLEVAKKYGLRLVQGCTASGFSADPSVIHYGSNSGFQAINLALHLGGNPIVLVGFDMRTCARRHFCGPHPVAGRNAGMYHHYIPEFELAAKMLPEGAEIINCTPSSALKCFPTARIEDVLMRKTA